jgi:SAM-dependent methyltransferase
VNDQQDISRFYDLRGQDALSSRTQAFGSMAVATALRAPYRYVETKISDFRDASREQHFLDLCCGTGTHSILPAKLGFNVYGIDLSEKSIRAAQNLAQQNGVEAKCRFQAGDAGLVGKESGPYDAIFMSGALYYFDVQQMVPKILAQLKAGGMFCCVETYGGNSLMNLLRKLRKDRDQRTMSALLRREQIRLLSSQFDQSEIRFFDFLTLFLRVLPPVLVRVLNPIATRLDFVLLNKLGLSMLAFKFTFCGRKGIK